MYIQDYSILHVYYWEVFFCVFCVCVCLNLSKEFKEEKLFGCKF